MDCLQDEVAGVSTAVSGSSSASPTVTFASVSYKNKDFVVNYCFLILIFGWKIELVALIVSFKPGGHFMNFFFLVSEVLQQTTCLSADLCVCLSL